MIGDLKNKARSVLNLKRVVTSEVFYNAIGSELATEFINCPKSGKVLILAPHPDDEVIGCGGALLKHLSQNDQVKIIYLTDGSLGFESNFKPSDKEKKAMVAIREKEAIEVGKALAIKDQIFLRYHDSKLSSAKSLKNFLAQTIRSYKPDIIYTPYLLDQASDHSAASKILSEVLSSSAQIRVCQYEVWSPLFANYYLNIDEVLEKKMDLIKIYKSQLKSRDYLQAFKSLASYRAIIFGKSKFAEAYFSSSGTVYKKLSDLIS